MKEQENALLPVVMLANGHRAFDTRIFVKQACSLAAAGYSVSVIVPHNRDEIKNGISIISIPPSRSGFSKLLINPWRIFRKALKQPRNAIFCIHDSDILISGVMLKLLRRKVIYDAHEDTPLQISYQHWIPSLLKRPYALFYYYLEKLCGLWFDAIIVAEPVIAKYFPAKRTFLVRNFPIARQFETYGPLEYNLRKNNLLYVGTLSKVRGLFEMLEGAKWASLTANFDFVLGGQFAPPSLEQQVTQNYKVTFLQWVSYEKLVQLLFDAKAGIIIPNPVERYKTNYPVKMFEFMAAGLPVIASSQGESAAFIRETGCGILVDPLNVDEIGKAIAWLFNNPAEAKAMGVKGRNAIMTKYNWEEESKTLLSVYSMVDR